MCAHVQDTTYALELTVMGLQVLAILLCVVVPLIVKVGCLANPSASFSVLLFCLGESLVVVAVVSLFIWARLSACLHGAVLHGAMSVCTVSCCLRNTVLH